MQDGRIDRMKLRPAYFAVRASACFAGREGEAEFLCVRREEAFPR